METIFAILYAAYLSQQSLDLNHNPKVKANLSPALISAIVSGRLSETVYVSIEKQTVFFFGKDRKLVLLLPCSTGVGGSTVKGEYTVRKTCRRAWSAKYSSYLEPCISLNPVKTERKVKAGQVAIHGLPYWKHRPSENYRPSFLGKRPTSHGCVRMNIADAKKLKDLVKIGTKVLIM